MHAGESDESPKLLELVKSEPVLAVCRNQRLLMIDKTTKRLYAKKRDPSYVAENRKLQSQVLNLRQMTRQAKVEREQAALSSIHNISLSMIEAIKGARMRRNSLSQSMRKDSLAEAMPRQFSLQPLIPRKSSTGNISLQMKTLTAKMEQIVQQNTSLLHRPALNNSTSSKLSANHSRTHSHDLTLPGDAAERVRMQLKRDIRRLDTKVKLLMSSLLLLEEEMALCQSECVKEKRKKMQRRANSLYAMMDFLKETRKRAAQYVAMIDVLLSGKVPEESQGRLAGIKADVAVMAKATRAIDFVTAQIEVKRRTEVTKRELVKYGQVSFSKAVPKILGRKEGL